ncbi:MAG: hypothetical protein ACLFQR_11455, partial [Desulfovibrionales bacterium]
MGSFSDLPLGAPLQVATFHVERDAEGFFIPPAESDHDPPQNPPRQCISTPPVVWTGQIVRILVPFT